MTYKLILMLLLIVPYVGAQVTAPTQAGQFQYGNNGVATGDRANLAAWNSQNLKLCLVGSPTWAPGCLWSGGYTEAVQVYPDQWPTIVYQFAIANGYDYENLMLHVKQDYHGNSNYAGWHMDQFDAFEMVNCPAIVPGGDACGTPGTVRTIHGAWLWNGSYTDVSVGANPIYNGCGTACQINGAGYLYLGYQEPFAMAKITLTRAQAGGTVIYQYWNGTTWSDLTIAPITGGAQTFVDGTAALTVNGTITWYPPNDWARRQVNAIGNQKYWIRIGSVGPTTAPQIATARGDDWNSTVGTGCTNCGSGGANNRGWDATNSDGHHVNIGLGNLEFDPNPPTTPTAACNNQPCSAKHRYQARLVGYQGTAQPAEGYMNLMYTVGGVSILGDWLNYRNSATPYIPQINGTMTDDTGVTPSMIPAFTESLTETPTGNWNAAWTAVYTRYAALAAAGPLSIVGMNVASPNYNLCFVPGVKWCAHEFQPKAYYTGPGFGADFILRSTNPTYYGRTMQDFAPAYNPNGVIGFFSIQDNAYANLNAAYYGGVSGFQQIHNTWTADRRFMFDWTLFLLGWNQNIMMSSWSGSNAGKDDVYIWNNTNIGHLTTQLDWNCSSSAADIYFDDDSGFVKVGGDDSALAGFYFLRIGDDILRTSLIAHGPPAHYKISTAQGQYATIIGGNAANQPQVCPATGNYPVGTNVQFLQAFRQSNPATVLPTSYTNLGGWTGTFPAMKLDLGGPDTTSGWQPPGGAKGDLDPNYVAVCTSPTTCTGSTNPYGVTFSSNLQSHCTVSKSCSPIYRRDFVKGQVYARMGNTTNYEADFDVPGNSLPLPVPLYGVHSDGSVDAVATTTLNLRNGEGFVGLYNPISGTLTIDTTSLPQGTVGNPYSTTLAASGGTGIGYTWSLTTGALPSGLGLSSSGIISGTPTTAGLSSFSVSVADSGGNHAGPQALTITINSASVDTMVGVDLQGVSVQ